MKGPRPEMVFVHPPSVFVICSPQAFTGGPRVGVFPFKMGKLAPEPSQALRDLWLDFTHSHLFFALTSPGCNSQWENIIWLLIMSLASSK